MKVFIFIHGDSYEKYQVMAARDAGIQVFKPFKSRLLKKVFRVHNARPLNRKHELPLKKIWFHRMLSGSDLNPDDKIIFLFYESFNFSYSESFLAFIKRKYPLSKACFIFTNPPNDYNTSRIEHIRDKYDYIVSDVKSLALKYGYLFYPFNPIAFPSVKEDKQPIYDIFFVGADKGRLPILINLYESFKDNGLKCDFHIVGVSKEKQMYSDDINYNKPLSYDEVLQHIMNSNVILEIVQGDLNYYTFRVAEAMLLHKKLVSTNVLLDNDNMFNKKILRIFSSVDEVDKTFIDFINGVVSAQDFPDSYNWKFEKFISFLLEH